MAVIRQFLHRFRVIRDGQLEPEGREAENNLFNHNYNTANA